MTRGKVELTVLEGPIAGRKYEFDQHDVLLFGRDEQCHVQITEDPYVSRHHFALEVNPPRVCLRDLGSRNGTFVNENRHQGLSESSRQRDGGDIPEAQVPLTDGDTIKVGKTAIRVSVRSKEVETLILPPDDAPEVPSTEFLHRATKLESASGPEPSAKPEAAGVADLGADAAGHGRIARLFSKAVAQSAEHPQIPYYELRELIGRGGMGEVYLAKRRLDDKSVAVKVLHARIATDAAARDQFQREIQIVTSLEHQNLVQVHHSCAADDTFFFVMEYCQGRCLGALARSTKEPLPVIKVVRLTLHALAGLAFAHEHGIVHRDVKPENLLLARRKGKYQVKVSDFGLAKNFEQAGFSGMTATGSYGGTYYFMPREQLTHYKYLSPASDVWSMAATAFYLLTKRLPRDFDADQDPIDTILEGRIVPIRKVLPGFPVKIAKAIDRALNDNLKKRYADAAEFREVLSRAAKSDGVI